MAAVEVDIQLGDVDSNLQSIYDGMDRAARAGAKLIVLPELATSGFVENQDVARSTAMPANDPRLTSIARVLPSGVVGVVGFCENADGVWYNSALIVTAQGALHHYRKTHLWGMERHVFEPGQTPPCVVDTPVGRLGLAICYDNEFPEVPRGLAIAGAEVLALPVNWPLVDRPAGEHAPETIQAMAAARSSRLATVIADRRGSENGIEWTGGTAVISSDGWIQATPVSGMALAEVELPRAGFKRIGELNDLFADRRPELYSRD